jgi:hypothetical protein
MNLKIWIPALLLAVSGAAQAAKTDLDYARLRASLNDLAADPVLGKLAPAERALAEQAVQAIADTGGKEHAHLVYLSPRRVDIAATAQAIDQSGVWTNSSRARSDSPAASRHEQARLEAGSASRVWRRPRRPTGCAPKPMRLAPRRVNAQDASTLASK